MRPMNTGIIESSSATTKPAMNRPMNRPLAWRAKCQKKPTSPGGGSGCCGNVGRLQQPLKQAKHGTLANTGAPRPATALAPPRSTTRLILSERGAANRAVRDRTMASEPADIAKIRSAAHRSFVSRPSATGQRSRGRSRPPGYRAPRCGPRHPCGRSAPARERSGRHPRTTRQC